jgi:two-component system, OmpR family, osmolarity sensor histidine kinase EnvZ
MLNSLRSRNIALLVAVVVAGQILSVALTWTLAIRPQAERVGGIMARNVAAISLTMDQLPPERRRVLIADINRGGAIRILPGDADPPEDRGFPTAVERIFTESFAREMATRDVVIWRGSRAGQLWVRVPLGGEYWWLSYERPAGWSPTGAIGASFAIALSLALIGGLFLQRRVGKPLRAFAEAADALRTDAAGPDLPTDGPREIAMVARSFNHMRARLADQERERAFMLAGISHDLRTPLAKIRLLTAMIPDMDSETEAMLARQYAQMDQMLAQFLDFARAQEDEALAPVDVGAMVQDIAEALGMTVEQSGLADMPVNARPLALRRALTNILRNASLYGRPPVSVDLMQQGGHMIIAVSDHGDGVSAAKLDDLARPFVRGADARPSDGGTGLGLAIARHVALAHGGEMRLSNGVGGGLLVEIQIPA